MHRFNSVIKISDWQTRAMGLRQPHPSCTAVCSWLLWYHSRAPQRKQAAKPKIVPIRPITDPYSKVIISRGDEGGSVFSLSVNLGCEGLQRRLRKYSRWRDKSFKKKCCILGKLGTDSHVNKSFSRMCSAVFVQRIPYFEWMPLDI